MPVDGGDFVVVSLLAPVADEPEVYGTNRSQAAGVMVEDCIELVNLAGSVLTPTDGFTLTLNIPKLLAQRHVVQQIFL